MSHENDYACGRCVRERDREKWRTRVSAVENYRTV